MVSVAISILAHLLITLRWRHGTNIWEAQYVVLIGVGFGSLLSTTFIGLSASAPKPQLATAIGMYYLSQQFGEILGVSIAATILRGDFRNTLQERLGSRPDAKRVSNLLLGHVVRVLFFWLYFWPMGFLRVAKEKPQNREESYADLLCCTVTDR